MLNLVVNILYGLIGQSVYTGYVYNKIKNKKYKLSWVILLVSTLISFAFSKYTYNYMYITYILISAFYYLMFAFIYKEWKQITNFFLILNIMLITSILTAVPIMFVGYNKYSLFMNMAELVIFTIVIYFIPFNKLYKFILKNWNRTNNNKIKSVTIRNIILILVCIFITVVNIILNNFIINSYQSVL